MPKKYRQRVNWAQLRWKSHEHDTVFAFYNQKTPSNWRKDIWILWWSKSVLFAAIPVSNELIKVKPPNNGKWRWLSRNNNNIEYSTTTITTTTTTVVAAISVRTAVARSVMFHGFVYNVQLSAGFYYILCKRVFCCCSCKRCFKWIFAIMQKREFKRKKHYELKQDTKMKFLKINLITLINRWHRFRHFDKIETVLLWVNSGQCYCFPPSTRTPHLILFCLLNSMQSIASQILGKCWGFLWCKSISSNTECSIGIDKNTWFYCS